ncbi:MAG: hypothetical protein KME65_13405 [Candidatus Thiodiazotropha sp. (ex Ctena orbiculata)]|uniref:Uncharacterized protein n=1 Tax=Candidatus Thiodiazotropha taylori TaxID=2792791 RepID=A0A944QVF3_9GAMM|nr:hypothetical protein [Candidatus Thiodiazotropha taylori]
MTQNPWQREGVSILPERLGDLMPMVGQPRLFKKLESFREQIVGPGRQDLAGFFMVIGGWGVGKSRVGHELCLEAFSEDVDWIIEGKPARILEAGLSQGVLPIFLRYIQVTKGPLGGELEADNWIPRVTVEALSRLAGLREESRSNRMERNQDRIFSLARAALKPKGWDRVLPELKRALQHSDPHEGARRSIEVLKGVGIQSLWLVVDEIEDITDVERDGLRSEDREGIDQGLLTVIPRVIKAEESRMEFPEVNFLLLCSLAVGDLLRQIRAIERRTGWYELTTNTFADVEAFFQYLESFRPPVAEAISDYPHGLKESAFFAANRNFGWFNVIMHYAHGNHRGGTVDTPDLLRSFAESSTKGGEGSVFDLGAISAYHLDDDADYEDVRRRLFTLLPAEVGEPGELTESDAARLLGKHHAGVQRNIFMRVVEVSPPPKTQITAHLVRCGFENTRSTELHRRGEARFDLKDVMDSLEAYAISLPKDRRDEGHLLISEDEEEFISQIAGLSPYPEQAREFAPYLHGLLMDRVYRVHRDDETERWFLAPAFSFLLRFNQLNKVRQDEQGYLRDSSRNSRLEEAWKAALKEPTRRVELLLKGLVNCWEGEKAPVELASVANLKCPAAHWHASGAPINLAQDGEATVVYAAGAAEVDLEHDLKRLAQSPAQPILLIFEDQDQRIEEYRTWIERIAPRIAPFIVIHNLARYTADEHLVRLGLMGEAFEPTDLRTSHFHAVIGNAKQHLQRVLEEWLEASVISRGLVLKPVFYGSRLGDDDLKAFAKGYGALLAGQRYHDITQTSSGVFEDEAERDRFKSMVSRNSEPPPKYADAPREQLIDTESGEQQAVVPSCFVTLLERCGPVPVSSKDLEHYFLFDIRDEHGKEVATTKEVLRHLTSVLLYLGMLKLDGAKLARASVHELQHHAKSATAWLDTTYEKDANAIKAIHQSAGDVLLNVHAKDARHRLKQAERKLGSLNLDFVNKPWEELNKETDDDMPVYEQRFLAAATAVRDVESDVRWVYDPEELRLFRYSADVLHVFDKHAKSPAYPLWRRLAVLKGFYADLDEQRKQLITRIDAVLRDIDHRVPALTSGPDAGQKAFPTQAIERPLDLIRQEIGFAAENPEKTIAAGSTTLSIHTIGYKLAAEKYGEALDRLSTIQEDLTQPGKLVDSFLNALDKWEELRKETEAVGREYSAVEAFFSDAAASVISEIGLKEIAESVEDLRALVLEGGIRQGTDDREAAGTRVQHLVEGLWEDLRKIEDDPRQMRERIDGVLPNVQRSLEAQYQIKYQARLNALTRIRGLKGEVLPHWPDQLGKTYGASVAAFEKLIGQIGEEGNAFFAGESDTTFDVLVGYCQLELEDKAIDWNAPENRRHVQALMDRGLLQLKLVSP